MIGVAQSTVSRWERGDSAPTLDEMRAIRAAAVSLRLDWRDCLFFDEPMESVS
ncbi:helix-turn-helix transcriptional regulator [Pararhizobium haloflavum]|uniref:helix-turn-helix transcriptional regulator n=1 Tax=Pararhizobium haloflavum TaxID=2037914 RepID=UPI003522ADFD